MRPGSEQREISAGFARYLLPINYCGIEIMLLGPNPAAEYKKELADPWCVAEEILRTEGLSRG
jgi:hypothetical protein